MSSPSLPLHRGKASRYVDHFQSLLVISETFPNKLLSQESWVQSLFLETQPMTSLPPHLMFHSLCGVQLGCSPAGSKSHSGPVTTYFFK